MFLVARRLKQQMVNGSVFIGRDHRNECIKAANRSIFYCDNDDDSWNEIFGTCLVDSSRLTDNGHRFTAQFTPSNCEKKFPFEFEPA